MSGNSSNGSTRTELVRPRTFGSPTAAQGLLSLRGKAGTRQGRPDRQCARPSGGLVGRLRQDRPQLGDRPVLQMHLALADLSTRARKPWNGTEPLASRTAWHRGRRALDLARDRTRAPDVLGRGAGIPLRPQRRRRARGDRLGPAIATGRGRHLARRDIPVGVHAASPRPMRVAWMELGRPVALRTGRRYPIQRRPVARAIGPSRSSRHRCSGCTAVSAATRRWWERVNQPDHRPRVGFALFRLPHHEGDLDSADIDHRVGQRAGPVRLGADRRRHRHHSVERSMGRDLSPAAVQHEIVPVRQGRRLCAQGHSLGVRSAGPCIPLPERSPTRRACLRRSTSTSWTGGQLSEATPYGDIPYGPGSYNPVSLDWNPNQSGSDAPPLWQADAKRDRRDGRQYFREVGNRGSQPATNVDVSVWWRHGPAAGPAEMDDPPFNARGRRAPRSPRPRPRPLTRVLPPAQFDFTFNPPPAGHPLSGAGSGNLRGRSRQH